LLVAEALEPLVVEVRVACDALSLGLVEAERWKHRLLPLLAQHTQ